MAKKAAEDARMAKLYREVVLKEKPVEGGFVPVDMLGGINAAERRKSRKKSAASAISYYRLQFDAKKKPSGDWRLICVGSRRSSRCGANGTQKIRKA